MHCAWKARPLPGEEGCRALLTLYPENIQLPEGFPKLQLQTLSPGYRRNHQTRGSGQHRSERSRSLLKANRGNLGRLFLKMIHKGPLPQYPESR